MKSLSSVGLGLSIIFGFLLLALIAEFYYLLWWKKRLTNRQLETDFSNPAADFLYMFCWKKQSSMDQTAVVDTQSLVEDQQQHQFNKDLLLKPLGDEISGPPRFLFPIMEETKEEMESEDNKSRSDNRSRMESRGRSFSDLPLTMESPYLTPIASPSMFTPPLTSPIHVFNHFSESAREAEFNRKRSSPPPKFKFLQDAEEKLRRKLMEQNENRTTGPNLHKEEEDESFLTIIVDGNKERVTNHHHEQFHFASSPSTFSRFS